MVNVSVIDVETGVFGPLTSATAGPTPTPAPSVATVGFTVGGSGSQATSFNKVVTGQKSHNHE